VDRLSDPRSGQKTASGKTYSNAAHLPEHGLIGNSGLSYNLKLHSLGKKFKSLEINK
jgi:hypothetical protein